MFDTVLVANRGEIALPRDPHAARASASARSPSTATPTRDARTCAKPTSPCGIGPAPAPRATSTIDAVLAAARDAGAAGRSTPATDSSRENADFARACADGRDRLHRPRRARARGHGRQDPREGRMSPRNGVPVVPGIARAGLTDAQIAAAAAGVGYPLLVKPSAGGGGKGMQVVRSADELPDALADRPPRRVGASATTRCCSSGSSNARATSRCRSSPTRHGTVIHLGERECTLQRRHQKVIEEAPSPVVDAATRGAARRRGRARPRQRRLRAARAPSSSSSRPTGPTSSSSSR